MTILNEVEQLETFRHSKLCLPHWEKVTFGDIFEITSSKRVLQKHWLKTGIPFYRAREIVRLANDGYVDNDLFISEDLYQQYKQKFGVPEAGDLMVSAVGTLGACYIVKPNDSFYFKDASVLRFHPKRLVHPQFIYYAFRTPEIFNQIHSTSGSTVNTLTISRANEIQIFLPPLAEQKRIAAILDQADELRRKRQRAIDRLNQLGQAIFYEMFGDWTQAFYPKALVKLGNVLDFLTSGSRGWASYYSTQGSFFLRIQNVRSDNLDLSDVACVRVPQTVEAKRTRVLPGDVLLSITADLGRTAVIPDNIGEAYINQHLSILRTNYFNPRFLSAALASIAGQKIIKARNKEGVKAGLNFDDIKSFEIPDFSRVEQDAFAQRMNYIDQQKMMFSNSILHLNSLFNSLQHRAFRGEL